MVKIDFFELRNFRRFFSTLTFECFEFDDILAIFILMEIDNFWQLFVKLLRMTLWTLILVKFETFLVLNYRQIKVVLSCFDNKCFNLTIFYNFHFGINWPFFGVEISEKLLDKLTYLTIIQLCFSFGNISHDFDGFLKLWRKKHRRRENIKILNVMNFLSSSLTRKEKVIRLFSFEVTHPQ